MVKSKTLFRDLGIGLLVASQLLGLSTFLLFVHYDATRPTTIRIQEGRVYDWSNHGHVVYLTQSEQVWLYALGGTSGISVMAAMALYYLTEPPRKRLHS
jgi:hypothetical protein